MIKVLTDLYGRKPAAGKSEVWFVREHDKAKDLLQNVMLLGYSGAFEMPVIRYFILRKAVGHVFKKTSLYIGELLNTC